MSTELVINGRLDADSVLAWYQQSLTQLQSASAALVIDLSQVTYSDSSGLAMLLACLRAAKAANKTLTLIGVPKQLQAIAELSNLQPLLAEVMA